MIYIENNGTISRLSVTQSFTVTHSPVNLWDSAGGSVDSLEALLNSTPYQLLIDCLPLAGGEIVKAAIVYDEKAQNSNGGTFTAGAWRQRDLNTEIDPSSIVSVASNAITILEAGNYVLRASAPAFGVNHHQARLTKNNVHLQQGTSEYINGLTTMSKSIVTWAGALAVNDVIRLEHYCESTYATYGYGTGDGSAFGVEVFSIVEIIQYG